MFAGQSVGIKQVSDHIWLVTFMDYDLGYFDHGTGMRPYFPIRSITFFHLSCS